MASSGKEHDGGVCDMVAISMVSTTTWWKYVSVVFIVVLFVSAGAFINSTRSNSSFFSSIATTTLPFTCPSNLTSAATCSSSATATPPTPPPSSLRPTPSCPDYFRFIHEDLRPWSTTPTGITLDAVQRAAKHATFQLTILGGHAYVEHYHGTFQTRDVFTLWGILQLLRRYPGRVPDLDLMFNCDDMPIVRSADYAAPGSPSPPPLFRYCKDNATLDIVFPDWSFWGWAEINIKPWELLMDEMSEGNRRVRWPEREPFAYWKGNPSVGAARQELMRCNVSKEQEWNARVYTQQWEEEMKKGFKESNLAKQCQHRYKIYIEGRAWSVSQKYILACDSPVLAVETKFIDFFSRGLMPGREYWPIRIGEICKSIKFTVQWGNAHPQEVLIDGEEAPVQRFIWNAKAQDIGKRGSSFAREQLRMDYVYDYMLHLLTEYAKLLKYKPTKPEKAVEMCLESMACTAQGREKRFLMESMEMRVHDSAPCSMPPPFDGMELKKLEAKKANYTKQVEILGEQGWESWESKV